MADVRALLAAERHSRRITHPHLTYSKSGALTCTICDLNIKSEQLWPGHLKSLNHRKNVQRITDTTSASANRPTKRKIESVDDNDDQTREHEVDSRKKPRPASQTVQQVDGVLESVPAPQEKELDETFRSATPTMATTAAQSVPSMQTDENPLQESNIDAKTVDEDEWAAFERDVAVLEQPQYASATIEAAPVTTADLVEQQESNTVQEKEDEAEAEKEEESRRLEEEFEVMEEMEERVKRLRERREALRTGKSTATETVDVVATEPDKEKDQQMQGQSQANHKLEGSDDDDASSSGSQIDDWYG